MKGKTFLTILFLIVLLPFPGRGGATFPQETALPQTVVEQDAFFFGRQVVLNETVRGNVLIIGNQVEVNGTIDGSLILVGQNVMVSGQVSGGTYALALTFDLGDTARLARDLYVAAVSLTSAAGSSIERDLFALGLDAGLNGHIGRSLHTILGPVQLYNAIMHLLGFDELTVRLHLEPPPASGSRGWHLPLWANGWGLGLAPLGLFNASAHFVWSEWLLARLRLWLALVLFALLLLWLARPSLENSGRAARQSPWKTLGTGTIALVAVINVFILLLALYVLVFALGLGLVYLGFWQMAVALWILSLAALSTLAIALWLFVLYAAKVIACSVLFPWLFAKLGANGNFGWLALALLTGTLVYTLLRAVPYVGGLIDLLVTAFGAGAAWLAWQNRRKALRGRRRKRALPVAALQDSTPG